MSLIVLNVTTVTRLRPSTTPHATRVSLKIPPLCKSFFLEPCESQSWWGFPRYLIHFHNHNAAGIPTMLYALHVKAEYKPVHFTIHGLTRATHRVASIDGSICRSNEFGFGRRHKDPNRSAGRGLHLPPPFYILDHIDSG